MNKRHLCKDVCGKFYQGSVQDVLDRYYRASLPYNPDYIVWVTSDCPLIDASLNG